MNKAKEFQISGHETFVLRRLWLPKTVRFIEEEKKCGRSPSFVGEEAMVKMGLGKNMLSSSRFWAAACGIITKKGTDITPLGVFLFDPETGKDKHCEKKNTQWLIHWNLCSDPQRLTIFWFLFNHVNQVIISKDSLIESFVQFLQKEYAHKFSLNSVHRDAEIVLRSYLPTLGEKGNKVTEETIECFLGELGLLSYFSKDSVSLLRDERRSLNDYIFAYAILDFWEKLKNTSSSLTYLQLANEVGSPGKIFRLNEASLVSRLEKLDELTEGNLVWTEQAGLKSLVRRKEALSNPTNYKEELLHLAFKDQQ